MTDELAVQFAQMQKYTATLHSLMTAAQSHAPRQSAGADKSGAVRITLGPDGLPASFRVDNDWDRKITPAAFGGAVMEAFQVAINDRMETWTRALAEDGWRDRVDQVKGPATATEGRIPAAFRKPVEEVNPRPIGDIAEDMFKAFDTVDALAAVPKSDGASGTDRTGKITISLSSSGLTSCTVDEHWAARQTAAQLMNALSQALTAAKEDLSRKSQKPQPMSGVDRLFAEAMALLHDPRRLAD
ncbi:hypothetical protein LWC34_02085 [Kibdelosporangium philippinense]|uniref:YbaB/EbfC DNA-binding family protein n=1 Tax=Kibdelosporangium philippinense TaxID=211113 RepID=A0ABS8Z1K2_9PSEU|nr:hypothetical protein [Kibdelosporangium philippinense]MCE7001635.1 hypothetical protein [Kibdelosporangium philippinense]